MNQFSNAPVAALDCGTNSTRLLIVAPDRTTLVRKMRITRLGQGVDAKHRLNHEAMQRTLNVLTDYKHEMDAFGVQRVRVVATSAVRDAVNGQAFLKAATDVIGVPAELLSGLQEGQLSYAGATSDLAPFDGDDLTVDIGGGSTEIVLAKEGSVQGVSLDIGCVRLTERYFLTDPPTDDEIRLATSAIHDQLKLATEALPDLAQSRVRRRFLGLAGTVSTLAMLDLNISEYERQKVHHHQMGIGSVENLTALLIREDISSRALRPAISEGRQDVIAGGALILREIMWKLLVTVCLVCENDILDGLAMSQIPG